MRNFQYKSSCKIAYWGCCFDSLLELKFAISIADEYEFLHASIPVYYDLKTKQPVKYIRQCTHRYTPDFLIRHKVTKAATWVEIKPQGFTDNTQLILRKQVAENYINWKKYDWTYKVVFGNEIVLNKVQNELFENLCRYKSGCAFKTNFINLNNSFDQSNSTLFSTLTKHIEFVMFGRCPSEKLKEYFTKVG